MFLYLLLLFTSIPLIELFLLLEVGRHIGILNTIAIVILTGIAGALLARSQGFSIMKRIKDDLNMGIMPAEKLLEGIIILCGGLLLLTPGLITDLAGFSLLIPNTRQLIKRYIKKKIKEKFRTQNYIDID
ncbi:FxsA family protein [Elusimicrobiota bacterium]